MVHGYHVVFGTYGFWLPNDLRGSWSKFVAAYELACYGKTTRGIEQRELTSQQQEEQRLMKINLTYPEVFLTGQQALAVATGFARAIEKSQFTVWVCSILPQHIHLVIARHRFKVEYIAGLLKGEATKVMKARSLHPLAKFINRKGEIPTPWNSRSYHGFLESEEQIEDAICYVVDNPMKEGKRQQTWRFVPSFGGLDKGWTTYR